MLNCDFSDLEEIGFDISDCLPGKNDKKIGWLCTYIPEEIIHASGFQPVRVSGRGNPIGRADSLLHTNMCPFVRSVLDDAVEGELEDLFGMVIANSCDAMKRLYDAWKVFMKDDTVFYLDLPKNISNLTVLNYADQLRKFSRALNQHDDDEEKTTSSLLESIKIFNKTRMLMEDVSRLTSSGLISGYMAFNIMRMATQSKREVFNGKLSEFLDSLSNKKTDGRAVRILLGGCIIDQPDLIKLMEEVGAEIVVNELCTGSRQFDQMVREDDDPFQALAERYLIKAPCARMMDSEKRNQYLLELVDKNKIDGVIYYIIKFCDHYMWDFPIVKEKLTKVGIPVLDVEGDYMKGSLGPLKTRIQAFVESLQS